MVRNITNSRQYVDSSGQCERKLAKSSDAVADLEILFLTDNLIIFIL